MRAHEAGALHADHGDGTRAPGWLRQPDDVNALLPELWPAGVGKDPAGVLHVGGLPVTELAERYGTPVYVVDEEDFRRRARAFRDAYAESFRRLAGADVYYAGKAFLCLASVRWVEEEGLGLDVCTGGELHAALRAGFPASRIALHGNAKSTAELERALDAGVGRVVVDSFGEIDLLARIAAARGVRQRVLVRVTVGVEAHTHEYIATAHEDQKFGFSLAGGVAAAGVRSVLGSDSLELVGLHSHIGSQIYDTSGFEVSARRLVSLHAEVAQEHAVVLPEMGLGGGFGIAHTRRDDPLPPADLAAQMAGIVEQECAAHGVPVPRVSVEPGRAIAGPSTFTLYTVLTVKPVALDAGAQRTYVAVDGGMSDNVRPALYGAEYSATLAGRASSAPPTLARVVGRHCESGDVVVLHEFLPADIAQGDLVAVPGTGAYCRSLASNYNHVPRPPVVAVRDGVARVVVRRETEDDLLRLDTP